MKRVLLLNPPISISNLWPAWGIFLNFVLLLLFFSKVDVYHQHFFSSGSLLILYNLLRVFYIFYFFWIAYAIGDTVLTIFQADRSHFAENTLRGFFTGCGVLQLGLFFLGLMGGYKKIILIPLSLLILLFSLKKLNQWLLQLKSNVQPQMHWGWFLIALPIIVFLFTKGLYPGGGHDYYNHYFHFYRTVVQTGSILPNDVWYHFYYSKGAGLFFYSMVLTDALAPQLVTVSLVLAGGGVVYSMIKSAKSSKYLPWIAITLFILFLIYTPGHVRFARLGGWGDVEKLHEPAAMLMLGILWLVSNLLSCKSTKQWGIALVLTSIGLILMNWTMVLFAGLFSGAMCLYCYLRSQKKAAKWLLLNCFSIGITCLSLLLFNFILTGMPEDQNIIQYWSYINFEKIEKWGVLFEVLLLKYQKTHMLQTASLHFDTFLNALRLDVWLPLLLPSLILFIFNRNERPGRMTLIKTPAFVVCSVFLTTVIVATIILGGDQPISYYRFTSFSYGPMLCFSLLLLANATYRFNKNRLIFFWVMFALIFTWNIRHNKVDLSKAWSVIQNGLSFVSGQYSLEQAYQHQRAWPGRKPWGGIYPPMKQVWEIVGPNTPIWSMHIHSYCMLPDCDIRGFKSFKLTSDTKSLLVGTPEVAKKLLVEQNLNYFFFSNILDIEDILPESALFSPMYIADYLGIVWTDGNNTLLTWKENAKSPIDAVWLSRYEARVHAMVST